MAPILGIWASSSAASRADTGAMFPLQVITVGPAGASSVSFTNIPNTYTHLQIRCLAKAATTVNVATNANIQFNSDTGSNYTYHYLRGDGSSASAIAGTSQTSVLINDATVGSNASYANMYGAYIVDILDYANTNKYKTVRILSGADVNASGTQLGLGSSVWMSTSAINRIDFSASSNFVQYSQFALYGIKAAS